MLEKLFQHVLFERQSLLSLPRPFGYKSHYLRIFHFQKYLQILECWSIYMMTFVSPSRNSGVASTLTLAELVNVN